MSGQIAPYNDSLRVGSGFNSYTQQLRVNDAVIKENKTPLTDKDLNGKKTADPDTTSQQVTFTSKFVEHASDITDALNISGALEIKYQGVGAKASGSYLDSSKVKESDINYFVQVKVVNQQLTADDATKFNVIPNIPVTDKQRFTEVYGDSFISGFHEGGEFNALLSIKVDDKESITDIKGELSVALSKAGFGISGSATGSDDMSKIIKGSETTITVSWSGGGDIRDEKTKADGWTVESMAKAAFAFPDCVRHTPQRTHAILTKYSTLRSYQLLSNKGSPLDYENAGVYTNSLLESYLEYKDLWKMIGNLSTDYAQGKTILTIPDTATETAEQIKEMKRGFEAGLVQSEDGNGEGDGENIGEITDTQDHFSHLPDKAYPATLVGLEKARRDCRLQMISIVKEVDDVANDPKVAVDFSRVGIYLSPLLFRRLLPVPEHRPTEKEIRELRERLTKVEAKLAEVEGWEAGIRGELQTSVKKLTDEINSIKERLDANLFDGDTEYTIQPSVSDAYWLIRNDKNDLEVFLKRGHRPAGSGWNITHVGEGNYLMSSGEPKRYLSIREEKGVLQEEFIPSVPETEKTKAYWSIKADQSAAGTLFSVESVAHTGNYLACNWGTDLDLSKIRFVPKPGAWVIHKAK